MAIQSITSGQDDNDPSTSKKMPDIYIDCEFCDKDYLKQEINFVSFMRDQVSSEIYILITKQSMGSGGTEFSIFFVGEGRFGFLNDILKFMSEPDNTEEEIRAGITNMIKIGLVRYLAKTDLAPNISISYVSDSASEADTKIIDPWNSWVFELDLGAWMNGEEGYRATQLWGDISANRVTEEWKVEMNMSANYKENRFIMPDDTILGVTRSQNSGCLLAKSINDHWSIGGKFDMKSSSYNNIKLGTNLYPAIEYNLFPYAESSKKQLRFLYMVGYGYASYTDTTIFDKTDEHLFGENLVIAFEMKERWGSISAYLVGFNYLHDFSKNRLNISLELNLRITKGLSFQLAGGFSFIHDQLSLAKKEVSGENILLRQQQMATEYSYNGMAGLTYTFGSVYNNVVNPRFGN